MTNPSDRVLRVDVPLALPGACVLCGKSKHDDGFVTFDNLDFEFYGRLYFCADCVGDVARAMNYLSPAVKQEQSEQIKTLTNEVETLRRAVLLMEETVDNLATLRDLRSSGALDGSSTVASVPVSSEVEPSEAVSDAGAGQLTIDDAVDAGEKPDSGTDESGSKSGRNDVYDSASISDLLEL